MTAMMDVYTGVNNRPEVDSAPDFTFLVKLSQLTGNPVYAELARERYQTKISSVGDYNGDGEVNATDIAEYIRDARHNQGYDGLIPWDINLYVQAALTLNSYYPGEGYDKDAIAMAEVIYQDMTGNPGYFKHPVNEWFYYYVLGLSGALQAFTSTGTHLTGNFSAEEIKNFLIENQSNDGSWNSTSYWDGTNWYWAYPDIQSTAYAVMALISYGDSASISAATKAADWLISKQNPNGGWTVSSECPEVDSEVAQAIFDVIQAVGTVDVDHGSDGTVDLKTITIQQAINAAYPYDTIIVHEGTYMEQLIINKSLTLIGDTMPKIVAPDTRTTFTIPESSATFDPIIFAYGSLTGTETISVTIEGFEIDGGNKAASGYRFVGILYRNVKPGIISNNVLHSLYPPSGKGSGPETIGILIYGDSEVEIYQNEIRDFSRVGIGASGDAGPNVDPVVIIQENTVFGNGLEPETDWWAENGIQVGYGASGEVIGNQVFNCTVNNPNWAASGIIIVDTHEVTVDSNYVEGCDVGINAVDFPSAYGHPWDYDILSNVLITRNVLVGNIWQIDVSNDARNVTITYNNIINAIEDGIDIWSYFGDVYPTDVKIHYNNIEGSGSYGIWASEELAAQPVDARFNWWGSATGPYHPTLNDYGKGDNVSDNIDFWNWLIIPYPPAIASPVPPVASFTYTPFAPIVNEYVTFDASGSYSIDGYITTYVWDFGDGNLTETSNPIIMHKFDSAGTYSVNLTVIDNLGATRSCVKDVIVYPPPPTNVKISPYESSVCIGQEFTINIVIENVSDLAGFELKLFWNTTLADLEDVDIFPPWSDYFLVKNETQEDIGDGRGMFWLALLMLPPSEPFNGTTVLATLTFNATNIGTSILDLDQVKLGDSLANPIPTNIVDGYIESHIAIPGDVDGNGHVDIYDLIIWADAFGTFAGEPDFNPAADLNNDGVIDIYDGLIIAINYGA